MGCCGGHHGKLQAARTIVSGHANRLFDRVFIVRGRRYAQAQAREAICRQCDQATWLTKADYLAYLAAHGPEVLRHLDDLTALEPLAAQPYAPGRSLFCRLCKCWIPAKCYAAEADCPMGRWPRRSKSH